MALALLRSTVRLLVINSTSTMSSPYLLTKNTGVAEVAISTTGPRSASCEINVTSPCLTTLSLLRSLKLVAGVPSCSFQLNVEGNYAAGGFNGYNVSKTAINELSMAIVL